MRRSLFPSQAILLQARLLAKQLRDTTGRLHTLQSENQFLKSELELMHQCSTDADERLDALRRHFQERIRDKTLSL